MNYLFKKAVSFLMIFCLVFQQGLLAAPSVVFEEEFDVGNRNSIVANDMFVSSGESIGSSYYSRGDIGSVSFDGMCDYITFETSNSGFKYSVGCVSIGSSISISLWLNMSHSQSNPATLIEMLNSSGDKAFSISTDSLMSSARAQGLTFRTRDNAGRLIGTTDTNKAIDKGVWTHVALTFKPSSGEAIFYLNGSEYRRANLISGNYTQSITTINLGRSSDSSGFIGSMDEVKIYYGRDILTPEEVKSIYENESSHKKADGEVKQCKSKSCGVVSIRKTDPISDIFGKNIFTKKTFTYECISTVQERGACITEESNITFALPEHDYNASYIDTMAGGSLNEIASIVSAQSFASKIMSGWKGYCVQGVNEDFSWAEDPYFWSSIALSVAMSYVGGSGDVASQGVKEGTKEVAKETTKEVAKETTKEVAKEAVKEAASKELFVKMANYASCAVQAGLDIGEMESADEDEVGCDPVDQICETEDMSYDDQVYSMDATQYNDMLTEYPEYAENITVLSNKEGYVQFSIVYSSANDDLSSTELDAAIAEQKEKMKNIQRAAIAISAISCFGSVAYSGGSSTSTTTNSNDEGYSAADGATAVSTMVANIACGPACGAAVQVVAALATSFEEVDSCESEEDAEEMGSRHAATLKAKQMGLCKYIKNECVVEGKLGGDCQLNSKHYCCYDTILTKVLAEQVKAQLTIDWAHCTGISLNEFMHIKFSKCDTETSFIDGTKLPYGSTKAQRRTASQYTQECLDYTEYINHILKITGGRINEDNIEDMIMNTNTVDQCSF